VQFLLLGPSASSSPSTGAGAYYPGASGGEIEGIDEFGKIHVSGGNKGAVVQRKGAWRDVWLGGGVVSEALSGFVLGWAGVGGVLR
jgi:ER membrane protein complex subunit 6